MSEATVVRLPDSLPYPVTVINVFISPGVAVKKLTTLLKYKYLEAEEVPKEKLDPEEVEKYKYTPKTVKIEQFGSFECPIEGTVENVNIEVGQLIEAPVTVASIKEPCTHSIQFGGLCGICGANLADEVDYSGFDNKNRAPISMSHSTNQLTVSYTEAAKIEKSTRQSLLDAKKLILVVDLDQTIIQTINDPTVYSWQQDPKNPNYEAVKDVKAFSLVEKYRPLIGEDGASKTTTSWYYVKLRPGLKEFLEKVSPKYEMHIYTMATRDYAKEIAKIVDPDEKYFGDRILSRDESGSITKKYLRRLFPTNTSMVVIIDDRGDVWKWSPNLIKVVPYDFFVGIGDINSTFLPKQNHPVRPTKKRKIIEDIESQFEKKTESNVPSESLQDSVDDSEDENEETVNADSDSDSDDSDSDESSPESSPEPSAEQVQKSDEALREIQNSKRAEYLTKLESERPLAKLQETLEKKIENKEDNKDKEVDSNHKISSHTLLSDDDDELYRLSDALLRVNEEFYRQYTPDNVPDIKDLMPELKSKVLRDTYLVFSGVIPLNVKGTEPEIIIWARTFGANVANKISSKVTHVISYEAKTAKVRLAKTLYDDKVKIVHPNWLFACFSRWENVPTKEYEIPFDPKDRVDDRNMEKLKESIFEEDNEELVEQFGNLDRDAIRRELEEFLSDDDDDEDEEDDDEEDENNNNDDADDNDNEASEDQSGTVGGKRPPSDDNEQPAKKMKLSEEDEEELSSSQMDDDWEKLIDDIEDDLDSEA